MQFKDTEAGVASRGELRLAGAKREGKK